MALPIKDPYGGGEDLLNQGSSRITASATSAGSAAGVVAQYKDAMYNANSLVSALRGITGTVSEAEQKQQDLLNKEYQQAVQAGRDVDNLKTENATGGILASVKRYIGGTAGPTPAVKMWGENLIGKRKAAELLLADPEFAKVAAAGYAEAGTVEERAAKVKAIGERIKAKYLTENPSASRYFQLGFDEIINDKARTASVDALKQHVAALKEESLRQATTDSASNIVPQQYKTMAESVVRSIVGDTDNPANLSSKVFQIVGIENGSWNPDAISPTGVRGLTQTSNDRFNEIKERIRKERPDLYAQMKDRTDPRSSLIALSYEIPRMEKIASEIMGRPAKTAETYLLWNLGVGGGSALLRTIKNGGEAASVYELAKDNPPLVRALLANKELYAGKTLGEALNGINGRMKGGNEYYNKSVPISAMKSGVFFDERTGIPEGTTKWNYSWKDFHNSGVMGGTGQIDSRVVQALDQVSTFLGRKIAITSGHRTAKYNDGIPGAAKDSRHIHGDALDIAVTNPKEQREVIKFLSSIGVKGIGVYKKHMHIDLSSDRSWIGKGDNTPSISKTEIDSLKNEGSKYGSSGGFYRQQGFNGNTHSAMHSYVSTLARKHNISVADARNIVIGNTINSAMVAANNGNLAEANTLLTGFLTSYSGGLTPAETNKVLTAQTSAARAVMARAAADEAADKRRNNQVYADNMAALRDASPQQRASLLNELAKKFSNTKNGEDMRQAFMSKGLNPLPDSVSTSNKDSFLWRSKNSPTFWEDWGLSSTPKDRHEALSEALRIPSIADRYNEKQIREIIDFKFAMDRSGFEYDKNGEQPIVKSQFAQWDATLVNPILLAMTSKMIAPGLKGADASRAISNILNPQTANIIAAPWKETLYSEFSRMLNAKAMTHKMLGGELTPDVIQRFTQETGTALELISRNIAERLSKGEDGSVIQRQIRATPVEVLKKLISADNADGVRAIGPNGVPLDVQDAEALKFPAGTYYMGTVQGSVKGEVLYKFSVPQRDGTTKAVLYLPDYGVDPSLSEGGGEVRPEKQARLPTDIPNAAPNNAPILDIPKLFNNILSFRATAPGESFDTWYYNNYSNNKENSAKIKALRKSDPSGFTRWYNDLKKWHESQNREKK